MTWLIILFQEQSSEKSKDFSNDYFISFNLLCSFCFVRKIQAYHQHSNFLYKVFGIHSYWHSYVSRKSIITIPDANNVTHGLLFLNRTCICMTSLNNSHQNIMSSIFLSSCRFIMPINETKKWNPKNQIAFVRSGIPMINRMNKLSSWSYNDHQKRVIYHIFHSYPIWSRKITDVNNIKDRDLVESK